MSSKDDVTEEQIEFCKEIFGKNNILPMEINKSIYEQSLSVHGKEKYFLYKRKGIWG